MSWSKTFGPGPSELVGEQLYAEEPMDTSSWQSESAQAIHRTVFEQGREAAYQAIKAFGQQIDQSDIIVSFNGHADEQTVTCSFSIKKKQ